MWAQLFNVSEVSVGTSQNLLSHPSAVLPLSRWVTCHLSWRTGATSCHLSRDGDVTLIPGHRLQIWSNWLSRLWETAMLVSCSIFFMKKEWNISLLQDCSYGAESFSQWTWPRSQSGRNLMLSLRVDPSFVEKEEEVEPSSSSLLPEPHSFSLDALKSEWLVLCLCPSLTAWKQRLTVSCCT